MYKICRTEQSCKRQRILEQGLLELMLRHPFEDISISDLLNPYDRIKTLVEKYKAER